MRSRVRALPCVCSACSLALVGSPVVRPVVVHAQAQTAVQHGDPAGALTGTAKDVAVKDPASPQLAEVMETVGHNKIAINMVWVLLAGFLVMFMQAGFALVETGFTRAKNVAHTMTMNFMVYVAGTVKGLFYGNPSQRAAEANGVVTCAAFVFGAFYGFFRLVDVAIGNRVSAEVEIEGLDIPEMGVLGYPVAGGADGTEHGTPGGRGLVAEPSIARTALQGAD